MEGKRIGFVQCLAIIAFEIVLIKCAVFPPLDKRKPHAALVFHHRRHAGRPVVKISDNADAFGVGRIDSKTVRLQFGDKMAAEQVMRTPRSTGVEQIQVGFWDIRRIGFKKILFHFQPGQSFRIPVKDPYTVNLYAVRTDLTARRRLASSS